MNWKTIDTMPLGKKVRIKTITGMVRIAEGKHRKKNGFVHCFSKDRKNTSDLVAIAWQELDQPTAEVTNFSSKVTPEMIVADYMKAMDILGKKGSGLWLSDIITAEVEPSCDVVERIDDACIILMAEANKIRGGSLYAKTYSLLQDCKTALQQKPKAEPSCDVVEKISGALKEALENYYCQHTVDENGNGINLVDMLTPPDMESIMFGEQERALLHDALMDSLTEALQQKPKDNEDEVQVYTEVFQYEMSKGLGEKSPCACCKEPADVLDVVRRKGYSVVFMNCTNPKCAAYNKGLPTPQQKPKADVIQTTPVCIDSEKETIQSELVVENKKLKKLIDDIEYEVGFNAPRSLAQKVISMIREATLSTQGK